MYSPGFSTSSSILESTGAVLAELKSRFDAEARDRDGADGVEPADIGVAASEERLVVERRVEDLEHDRPRAVAAERPTFFDAPVEPPEGRCAGRRLHRLEV